MKKPKKPKKRREDEKGVGNVIYNSAFNLALYSSDKYHEWDKKQNYIPKDRLSVERVEKIMYDNWDNISLKQLTFKGMIYELAIILSEELREEKG